MIFQELSVFPARVYNDAFPTTYSCRLGCGSNAAWLEYKKGCDSASQQPFLVYESGGEEPIIRRPL